MIHSFYWDSYAPLEVATKLFGTSFQIDVVSGIIASWLYRR